jgi:hypothetical protein
MKQANGLAIRAKEAPSQYLMQINLNVERFGLPKPHIDRPFGLVSVIPLDESQPTTSK